MVKDLGSLNGVSESISSVRRPPSAQGDKSHWTPWRLQSDNTSLCLCQKTVDGWLNSGNRGTGLSCQPESSFFSSPFFLCHSAVHPLYPSLHRCVATSLHHYPNEIQSWAVGETIHCSPTVSFGFGYCSQTNQSRTVQGPVTEIQHGCVSPQLCSFSMDRIKSACSTLCSANVQRYLSLHLVIWR